MYVVRQKIILIKLKTFISIKKLMDQEVTFVAKDHIDTNKEKSSFIPLGQSQDWVFLLLR